MRQGGFFLGCNRLGFGVARYFNGGGGGTRPTWCWTFYIRFPFGRIENSWLWGWHERCWYNAYNHTPTPEQLVRYTEWIQQVRCGF